MPRKLSPEEATVMIIRRRLQQMEEDKIAQREATEEKDVSSDADRAEQSSDSDSAKG